MVAKEIDSRTNMAMVKKSERDRESPDLIVCRKRQALGGLVLWGTEADSITTIVAFFAHRLVACITLLTNENLFHVALKMIIKAMRVLSSSSRKILVNSSVGNQYCVVREIDVSLLLRHRGITWIQ